MKFTTTSLLVAAVACSLQFSVRGGGAGFPKILVSAADAEKTNRNHGHLHASAIAAIAGNEVVEAFHRDLHQASRAIDQHKKARAQSLRVLGAEEDGDGMGKAELKKELKKCEAERLAPSNLYVQTADTCRLRRRDDDEYVLKSTDKGTTWLFTDKPFKIESSVDTASFVADFAETFSRQPPNFALTAVLPSGQFEEPLVAVMEKAYMTDDGEIVKYVIRQSKSQAGNGISLADVVGEVGEGIDLEFCSFFIDAAKFVGSNGELCCTTCSGSECAWDLYCNDCRDGLCQPRNAFNLCT